MKSNIPVMVAEIEATHDELYADEKKRTDDKRLEYLKSLIRFQSSFAGCVGSWPQVVSSERQQQLS